MQADVDATEREQVLRLGLLEVGPQRLGIDIENLAEVSMLHEVLPLVSSRSDVLGAFELRGSIIPLYDPMSLCGLGPMPEPPGLAAVIEHGDRMIAIGIDRACGISEFQSTRIQSYYADHTAAPSLVARGVLDGGKTVGIVDVPRLFADPDLPSCHAEAQNERKKALAGATAYLSFTAGGADFGVEAVQIFGTVPRQKIEAGPTTAGACLGMIRYLGRRIPVLDATRLFGLGSGLREAAPEIVVLRFPNDQLVGFAVDVILRIRMVGKGSLRETPRAIRHEGSAFSSVLVEDSGSQVFILDTDALHRRADLIEMAGLSDSRNDVAARARIHDDTGREAADPVSPPKDGGDKPSGDGETVDERQNRYLLFRAGTPVAAELTQVVSILQVPERLTPIADPQPGFMGFFAHQGASVPLVRLSDRLGLSPIGDAGAPRVLMAGPRDHRVGFLVDCVDGIETSQYIARDHTGLQVTDRLIKLRTGGHKGVLPVVDLDTMATAVSLPVTGLG